eukprot:TRINITY_DN7550_c0_g2_i3.p1 TRINITY_DN7550_c0_g2~~TRINITY_DN7550_c0_g2_i3.p1  ORF type:complete len:129 (+),score=52.42 TRINITY_DN7550_c0_g2_i3:150-536(+)
MEVTPQYKLWIDECSQLYGGLDICALDLLHSTEENKDYILELNDTAIGLVHKYEHEDMMFMRDIVMMRLEEHYGQKKVEETRDVDELKQSVSLLKIELERERNEKEKLKQEIATLKEEGKKKKKLGIF